MKAPAFKKNSPRTRIVELDVSPARTATAGQGKASRPPDQGTNRGGASQSTMTSPAPTNKNATSVPVTAVTAQVTAEITHSRASTRFVSRASFTAATPITAMTAGAMPQKKGWNGWTPLEGV